MGEQVREAIKPHPLTHELWHIAGTDDVARLDQLLNDGADVNAGDAIGVTALMRAAYHGQLPMVHALIEHGADPNAKDRGGLTALMMAKHAGHKEIIEALLSGGAQLKREGAGKPRMIERLIDESPVPTDDHQNSAPVKASSVKTLHEPLEIWEIVHTTMPNADLPPTNIRRASFGRPLMLVCALLICAAAVIFVYRYGRAGSAGRSTASVELPTDAAATNPTPISRQTPTAASTTSEKPNQIVPQSTERQSVKPGEQVATDPAAKATVPVATAVALSMRRPPPPMRNKAATTTTRFFDEGGARGRNPVPRIPAPDSTSVKKEARPVQTQPAIGPAKPNTTPKPKTIQWP